MEVEFMVLLLAEREKLQREKENNLEKIEKLDEKIAECEENAASCAILSIISDGNIEVCRKKYILLKKGLRFSLVKTASLAYEKVRINYLEREKQTIEERRTQYKNQLIYYKEAKRNLKNENINLSNKIFIIDDELNKEANDLNKPKVLKKEAK